MTKLWLLLFPPEPFQPLGLPRGKLAYRIHSDAKLDQMHRHVRISEP
jgi:hypothetical protein